MSATEEPFDEILSNLETGRWNLCIIIITGIYSFFAPTITLNGIFLAPVVDFECDSGNQNASMAADACTYSPKGSHNSDDVQKCSKWNYSTEVFPSSLTSEFDLVCDYSYLRPIYHSTFTLGYFISSLMNGFLSDRYGRKSLIVAALLIKTTAMFVPTFIPNISVIFFFRLLSGLSRAPWTQSAFVLAMEVCDPKYRSVLGILYALPWALGTAWFGLMAYLIPDWRWLLRVTGVPVVVSLLATLWLLDESPRWLIVRSRHDEALKILEKAFKLNGKTPPPKEELLSKMRLIEKLSLVKAEVEGEGSSSYMEKGKKAVKKTLVLFRTPELRKRTLLMYMSLTSTSTVYYGLTYNAVNFDLNPYLYMGFNGLLEIPAYTVPAFVIAKYGRIKPISLSFLICGITILSLGIISKEIKWLVITLALTGKFFVSAATQLLYLIISEVFPTEVRLQGMGTTVFMSRIGVMIAPFITDLLGQQFPWAPALLFGCISLITGVVSLFIPETLNVPLPETVKYLEETARPSSKRSGYEPEEVRLQDELNYIST